MQPRHGPAVIDVHHVGAGQTGNESWSANVARELAALDTANAFVFAAGPQGRDAVAALTGREPRLLPGRSAVRLTLGLPGLLARLHSRACLVTYTPPLSLRTPMVTAVHDLSAFDPGATRFLSRRTATRYRLSIRFAARRSQRIVVPTRHTAEDLFRATGFPAERTVVAGIPVDPAFRELLVAPRPARQASFRVLMVGTLLPRKNARVVADAVALLAAEGRSLHLRVVGPVRDAGRADETYLNQLLGPNVSWSGYVSTAQLAQEYLAADVLAFPSLYEGFGIPVLEAMTAGTPVIASDASCLPEVVSDAGLLAGPDDVAAWAAALRRVMDDFALRDALVSRGRSRAADFTWARSARAIYAALVEVGGHGA